MFYLFVCLFVFRYKFESMSEYCSIPFTEVKKRLARLCKDTNSSASMNFKLASSCNRSTTEPVDITSHSQIMCSVDCISKSMSVNPSA